MTEKTAIVVGLLVGLVATSMPAPTQAGVGVYDLPPIFTWTDLSVGDVLLQGFSLGDSCVFAPFEVVTPGPEVGMARSLALQANEECRLTVVAISENPAPVALVDSTSIPEVPMAAEAPAIEPDTSAGASTTTGSCPVLYANSAPSVSTTTATCSGSGGSSGGSGGSSGGGSGGGGGGGTSGTKTVDQEVNMREPNGIAQTRKSGHLKFTFSGTSASTIEQSGTCWRNTWGGWVIDGCWFIGQNSRGSPVWRHGRGDFHRDDGRFYHKLHDKEYGYGDGTVACSYWYEGELFSPSGYVTSTCAVT